MGTKLQIASYLRCLPAQYSNPVSGTDCKEYNAGEVHNGIRDTPGSQLSSWDELYEMECLNSGQHHSEICFRLLT